MLVRTWCNAGAVFASLCTCLQHCDSHPLTKCLRGIADMIHAPIKATGKRNLLTSHLGLEACCFIHVGCCSETRSRLNCCLQRAHRRSARSTAQQSDEAVCSRNCGFNAEKAPCHKAGVLCSASLLDLNQRLAKESARCPRNCSHGFRIRFSLIAFEPACFLAQRHISSQF